MIGMGGMGEQGDEAFGLDTLGGVSGSDIVYEAVGEKEGKGDVGLTVSGIDANPNPAKNKDPTTKSTKTPQYTKIHTLRAIPISLHRRWKAAAAAMGCTMADFALAAIEKTVMNLERGSRKIREEEEENE